MAVGASSARATEVARYLGSTACTQCHADEARRWSKSHHDLAMQPANDETVLGDFSDARFSHSGVETRFFRRGSKFMVRTDGADGRLADFDVAYTFGFYPLQQYLIGFPDGRYQALSTAWDSRSADEGGQRWYSLYPDESIPHDDVLHWTKPSQNWNHTCADCHSTDLRKGYRADTDTFETTWSDLDVSCEACHGPGSIHVAWAEKGGPQKGDPGLTVRFEPRQSASWTTKAGTIEPRRNPPLANRNEIETCGRCHSRRSRIVEGVPPGRPLFDSHRVVGLDQGLYYADGQIREEVYVYGSFVQSAMYAAGVSCSDCHDSHSGELRAQGNALCTQCHIPSRFDTSAHHHHPESSAGAQCVECHMPSRVYMGVDARRDHSLRIPRPDLSPILETPNACTGCHTSMSDAWATKKLAGWRGNRPVGEMHWGAALHGGRSGAAGAEHLLSALATDQSSPAIARASAVSLMPRGARPESLGVFNEALHDESPIVRIAALDAIDGLQPDILGQLALGLLDDPIRVVRFEAARILAALPGTAMSLQESAKLNKILVEYRRAQELDADRPDAHLRLGALEQQLGRFPAAEAQLKMAIERGPAFVPSYVNLADLYRIQERNAEGEAILRQALVQAPGQADVLHALGLTLIRLKRYDEAVLELEAAADARPESARYQFVLAVALHETGKSDRARDVLRAANERHPGNPDIRSFLGLLEKGQ
jgi:predicted CXXCH cytochrome family protein